MAQRKKARKGKKRSRSQYWTSRGNKRFLKRDKRGRIVDNQSYKRASQLDQKRKSKAEKRRNRR